MLVAGSPSSAASSIGASSSRKYGIDSGVLNDIASTMSWRREDRSTFGVHLGGRVRRDLLGLRLGLALGVEPDERVELVEQIELFSGEMVMKTPSARSSYSAGTRHAQFGEHLIADVVARVSGQGTAVEQSRLERGSGEARVLGS